MLASLTQERGALGFDIYAAALESDLAHLLPAWGYRDTCLPYLASNSVSICFYPLRIRCRATGTEQP